MAVQGSARGTLLGWPPVRVLLRAVQWVLDFPVFYKVLVANTTVAMAVALVGSLLWTRHLATSTTHTVHWEFIIWFGAATLVAGILVNYAILWAALQPLATLHRLVEALRTGDMRARAERPLFADRLSVDLMETTNRLLDDLAAYQDRVADMSRRVTEQLETERKNIARELHDDTAQSLVALLLIEQRIVRAVNDEERARTVEEARKLTRHTLEGVRRMSIGLRPSILDDAGLSGALKWYMEEIMGNVLPPVKLHVDESIVRLPPVVELALYRIVQEALSNISKHASAKNVEVSLRRVGKEVVLRVADDGVGFDPRVPLANHREHLGLFTIKERARLAGGAADVISGPGKGTAVVAHLPVEGDR